MDIVLQAKGVAVADVQKEIDAALESIQQSDEWSPLRGSLNKGDIVARPGGEGIGVVETIVIAVATRALGALTQKFIDEVVWPRLKARFGKSISR